MSLSGASFAGNFIIQGAGITGGVIGGIFSDKIAGEDPRRRMLIQIVCTLVAAPFLLVFFLPHPGVTILYGCIFIFSFFMVFGTSNVTPLTCDLLPPNLRSTALGNVSAANCLAGSAGVMAAGVFKSWIGLGSVFGGISGLTLCSSAIMLVSYLFFLKRDLGRRPEVEKLMRF